MPAKANDQEDSCRAIDESLQPTIGDKKLWAADEVELKLAP